jgi:hypothetical protein
MRIRESDAVRGHAPISTAPMATPGGMMTSMSLALMVATVLPAHPDVIVICVPGTAAAALNAATLDTLTCLVVTGNAGACSGT